MASRLLTGLSSSTGNVDRTITGEKMRIAQPPDIEPGAARDQKGGKTVQASSTEPGAARAQKGRKTAQASNTEAGPSRDQKGGKTPHAPIAKASLPPLKVAGKARVVSGNEDLLVLPPIPRDIFKELTSLFADVDSQTGSTTEPETSEDEIERRKKVKRDMEG
jgi:hypothetical protein